MSHSLLLPPRYKRIGWWLFVPSFITGLNILITGYEFSFLQANMFSIFPSIQAVEPPVVWFRSVNLTYTIVGVLFIISALMVGFSKEQNEDEYIAKLRLSSLLWAVLINYILLIVSFLVVYDLPFLSVMTYNMFTVLLLFIFRFQYLLYRSKTAFADEK